MGESLRVLVYGSVDAGACDSVRLGVYRDLLGAQGVELRTWGEFNDYRISVPADYADRIDDAVRDGVATVDLSPLEWADVLLFRRWYGTVHACEQCDFAAADATSVRDHCRTEGHEPVVRDRIVRGLLQAIEADRSVLQGRAMVYELDDDLLDPQPWLGFDRRLSGDRDLIERFARRADLVTVATPTLAGRLRAYNPNVRVIRNAVVPEWYESMPAGPAESQSFLYYGSGARLHDYAVCRAAVDEMASAAGVRRVWLGSTEPAVRAVVDEALPYESEVRGFIRRLAEVRPSVGLAPVGQDPYSRSRSELHWLEYSLVGAATVASRTMGGGPYDVIRDGVDGLLARNKTEWREQLRRVTESASLRHELAGRARERVLAEYDVRQRVVEWADAFRWAAEHAGIASLRLSSRGRAGAAAVPSELAVEAEARANLAHRRLWRARVLEEARTLAGIRGGRDVCWTDDEAFARRPLVTVLITGLEDGRVFEDGPAALERALQSATCQTYDNVEILVVGEGGASSPIDAVPAARDPRVLFVAAGNGVAGRGAWVAPMSADGEFTPDHIELLLALATEHRLELVYGVTESDSPDGSPQFIGSWPPEPGAVIPGATLYSSRLDFFEFDQESWRVEETPEWNRWRRMMGAGVRMGRVGQVVYRRRGPLSAD